MTIKVVIQQTDLPVPASSVLVTGIVAQPGGQVAATPLTGRENVVENVVPGAGVALQVLPFWPSVKVFNQSGTGQALDVYPPVGMNIQGQALNVPVPVADQGVATFTWNGAGTWLVS